MEENLLKLKLDMAYRNLPMEEAQKKFAELTQAPKGEPVDVEIAVVKGPEKPKPKRKTVKALVPKK